MIVETLKAQVDALTGIGHFALMEKFVLKRGVLRQGTENVRPQMKPKECFSNAAAVVLNEPLLTYCEGFAVRPGIGIPIHHAWAMDGDGAVVDVTWNDPEKCEYLGVVFDAETLRSELLKNRVYGLLDVGMGVNVDLIRRMDPDLVREAEAHWERMHG